MTQVAIFPGTFDPLTYGHIDLVQRACKLFDKLILALAISEKKRPLFSPESRLHMAREIFANIPNIEICKFDGLLIDLAQEKKARVIIRGLRSLPDIEYGFQLANMNRKMDTQIETVLLPASPEFTFVSSSIVREIASMGGDVSAFVPKLVADAFKEVE